MFILSDGDMSASCFSFFMFKNPQGNVTVCGQLGHGDSAAYKAPKRVDSLLGKSVCQVSCGEDFTLCVSGRIRKTFLCFMHGLEIFELFIWFFALHSIKMI